MTYEKSHPSWVCGLKLLIINRYASGSRVTPFVGVWIETESLKRENSESVVTPFVGVWIETAVMDSCGTSN